MIIEFDNIINKIKDYTKKDLFKYCLYFLNTEKKRFPDWFLLTLFKWSALYGEKSTKLKKLNDYQFHELFVLVSTFSNNHISAYFEEGFVDRAFLILYNQQFYLQKAAYRKIFASQLKLFKTFKITKTYDPDILFYNKTGLTIKEFLYLLQAYWMYSNINNLNSTENVFRGYFDSRALSIIELISSKKNIELFNKLLTIDPFNCEEKISSYRNRIKTEDLQTMEMSFLVMNPFINWRCSLLLLNRGVFSHTINYYLYDYLKSQDTNFTTDFGFRLEKYVEEGLKELYICYKTEKQLKRELPKKSKLVDFYLYSENIYIEVKATEMQAISSVKPTSDLIYNSLKDSLFKAYFEQLLPVSKTLSPDSENWGIIITYKEFFWSCFSRLYNIGKDKYPDINTVNHLPPENVFIIDLNTWDTIVQIIKNGETTLIEILKKAHNNNAEPITSKLLFSMHLEGYKIGNFNLTFLEEEMHELELK